MKLKVLWWKAQHKVQRIRRRCRGIQVVLWPTGDGKFWELEVHKGEVVKVGYSHSRPEKDAIGYQPGTVRPFKRLSIGYLGTVKEDNVTEMNDAITREIMRQRAKRKLAKGNRKFVGMYGSRLKPLIDEYEQMKRKEV